MNVPRKYGLVRAIAWILKALGWVALIAFILGGIFGGVTMSSTPAFGLPRLPAWLPAGTFMIGLLTGLFWFVPLYAFGSILSLLLDIEENTRALSDLSSGEVAGPPAA